MEPSNVACVVGGLPSSGFLVAVELWQRSGSCSRVRQRLQRKSERPPASLRRRPASGRNRDACAQSDYKQMRSQYNNCSVEKAACSTR